jgi:Ca2+-binding RTX toxin-like protein
MLMNLRRLLLVAGAVSVAVLFMPLSAPAQGATPTCFGKPATIVGTSGNDTIYATKYSDVIASLGGGDSVHALAGNDLVCGSDGNDVIFDGYGSDAIDGGNGWDTVYLCPDGSLDHLVNVERVISSSLGCT